jgi:hypothetical protein
MAGGMPEAAHAPPVIADSAMKSQAKRNLHPRIMVQPRLAPVIYPAGGPAPFPAR